MREIIFPVRKDSYLPQVLEVFDDATAVNVFRKDDHGFVEEEYLWNEEEKRFKVSDSRRMTEGEWREHEKGMRERDRKIGLQGLDSSRSCFKKDEPMTDEGANYGDLMRSEWDPMTTEKALGLRAELRDWSENRQAGGYDVRLIEGAIAVCDEHVR